MTKSITVLVGVTALMLIGLFTYSKLGDVEPINLEVPAFKEEGEDKKTAPDEYRKFQRSIRFDEEAPSKKYPRNHALKELDAAKLRLPKNRQRVDLNWIERGPGNVTGRVRAIIVDPRDTSYSSWMIGTAGGGIWSTKDAGQSWELISDDIPNMAVTTLVRSTTNPDVVYAGTGEGYGSLDAIDGSGIWKTNDNGSTWEPLESTLDDNRFTIVNRMVMDPENDQVLIASTVDTRETFNGYLMKSEDGGTSWKEVFVQSVERVQQVTHSKSSFNPLYASVNSRGILKSEDSGETWEFVFDRVGEFDVERMEIGVAPTDPNTVYFAGESEIQSVLYKSSDGGSNWTRLTNDEGTPEFRNWMLSQGWYDNTVAVHPFNPDIVYVAGASPILSITSLDKKDSVLIISNRYEDSRDMEFYEVDVPNLKLTGVNEIRQLAEFLGLDPGLTPDDRVSVEINFDNEGMVHRLINSATNEIEYSDFHNSPIRAMNSDSDEQLVVSYIDLDQSADWTPGYYEFMGTDITELIVVHNLPYDTTENEMLDENPLHKAIHVFSIGNRRSSDVIAGTFGIEVGIGVEQSGLLDVVTDGYFQYFRDFPVGSKGVHVDHHVLNFVPVSDDEFYILNGNDGGVAFSSDGGETFLQTGSTFSGSGGIESFGMNTSQFYGVDKRNGTDQYVGGTQDNGSWVSPHDPDDMSVWTSAPSGDGFEAAWNYGDTSLVLETSQFNRLHRSEDAGRNWSRINIPEGPFLTRISASKQDVNLVYMTSEQGLLRSTDFGASFSILEMPEDWVDNSLVRVSLADPNVVWTGRRLRDNRNSTFISVDGGITYNKVNPYTDEFTGRITSFSTSPIDPATAIVTFGLYNTPKLLKTNDYGQTWTDLSGFAEGTDGSDNGFPDVVVYCALIMPYDTNIIWAGTEIGLVESRDGGVSWQFADNGIPPVSIWEMKIVNNEIILATHGRGVWTVELPELADYEPQSAVLGPLFVANPIAVGGEVRGNVNLRAGYDSSFLIVYRDSIDEPNMLRTKITDNNSSGDIVEISKTYILGDLPIEDTVIEVKAFVESYVGDQVLRSVSNVENVFKLYEPADAAISLDFDNPEEQIVARKFLYFEQPEGFENTALHSLHPYPDGGVFMRGFLQKEIVVSEETSMMTFDQIVLVETGEPGTVFGDEEFWDYVAIEGSTDKGDTWNLLLGGDASLDRDWLRAYDREEEGTSDLYRPDTLFLNETFASGDTVLLRFTLFSDAATVGWGWAVDNIAFGRNVVSTFELYDFETTLSPNPTSGKIVLDWKAPSSGKVEIEIYALNGNRVLAEQIRGRAGQRRWNANLSQLAAGQYILRIKQENKIQNLKLIKQ